MNLPSRRNACENAVNKKQIDSTIIAKSKPESKTPIISYDYEAAISQPDIPIYAKIDNNSQKASWSEASNESLAPTKKRNLHVCGKASVNTKKRGIAFKSKVQAKKVTKTRPSICNIIGIKKKSIPSTEIVRNIENYGKESEGINANRQTPPNRQVCSNKIFFLDIPILQLICVTFRRICHISETEQQRSQKITGILRTKLYFKKILIKLIKRDCASPEIRSAKFRA